MLLLSGLALLASMFAQTDSFPQKGVKTRVKGTCVENSATRKGVPGIRVRAKSFTRKRSSWRVCGETTTSANGRFAMDAYCEERDGMLNLRQESEINVTCEMSTQFLDMGITSQVGANCTTVAIGAVVSHKWTGQKEIDFERISLGVVKAVPLFIEAEKVGRALVAAGVGPRPRHTICLKWDGNAVYRVFGRTIWLGSMDPVLWKEPDVARFLFARLYGMSLLERTRSSWVHPRSILLDLPTDSSVPTGRPLIGERQFYAYSAGWGYFIAALGGADKLKCNELTKEAGATEAERIADTRNVGCRYWRLYRKWGYAPIWNALPISLGGPYEVSFETFMAKYEKTQRTARAVATGQAR